MKKEDYLKKRNELIKEANDLIESGTMENIAKSNEVMDKVKKLDEEFENAAKAAANLKALEDTPVASNIVTNMMNQNIKEGIIDQSADVKENEQYRDAFLNKMMGKALNDEQMNVFNKFNMTTEGNTIVVPQLMVSSIWRKVDELYPFYAETTKINVKGTYKLIQEDSSFDAEFYEEDDETKTGEETLKEFTLSGCELSRAIDVSWKLKEMSIEDFENYIVEKIAKAMGAALAHADMTGKGKPGKDDKFKPEPNGLITVLEAEENTPQIIEVDDVPTYNDLTKLFSLIKSCYKKTVYAKSSYIWNVLANIKDKNDRPYFITDATSGGVGRLFGAVVKEDDSVPDDAMVLGDASQYLNNFNKTITLDTEDNKKKRITSYIGYAIVDGAPVTNKAFSVLRKKKVVVAAKTASTN